MATFTRYSVHIRKKGNKQVTPGLRWKVYEYDHEDKRREFAGWASMTKFYRVYEDSHGHRYFNAPGLNSMFTKFKAWRMKRFYEARDFEVKIESHVLGRNWRTEVVRIAKGQVGITEHPAGSNKVKYSQWYGMIGPWCAMFVSWCYAQAGKSFRYAYVPYVVTDARAGRNNLTTTSSPAAGDLACYQFGHEPDHIGIFVRWTNKAAGEFEAVEGNTSKTSNDNGGAVMLRRRTRSQVVAFVKVKG